MWIARDKYGDLYLYFSKPVLDEEEGFWEPSVNNKVFTDFEIRAVKYSCIELDKELFSEVTFENSPKELVINNNPLSSISSILRIIEAGQNNDLFKLKRYSFKLAKIFRETGFDTWAKCIEERFNPNPNIVIQDNQND